MINAEGLFEILHEKGYSPRKVGNSYTAKCPCHDDKMASLSFKDGDTALIVKCFSRNCDVYREGIEPLLDKLEISRHGDGRTRYVYRSEAGVPLYRVVRTDLPGGGKTIHQERLDSDGRVIQPTAGKSPMDGVQRVLYRLPELAAGIRAGAMVFITEGEKACEALRKQGFVATTQCGGASAQWNTAWGPPFRSIHVMVWADNDEPGMARAKHVAESLQRFAASVTIILSATDGKGDDAYDHFEAGYTLEDVQEVERFEKITPIPVKRGCDVVKAEVTWAVAGLIPDGEITMLEGEPGCGKSMVALGIAAAISRGNSPLPLGEMAGEPGIVWYLSTEDRADVLLKPRLERIGANMDNIYITDDWDGCLDEEGLVLFDQQLEELRPRLVVLDAFLDLVLPAVTGDTPREVKPLLRGVRMALARHQVSSLAIRHVTKSAAKSGSTSMADGYGGTHYSAAARAQIRVVPGLSPGSCRVVQVKNNYQPLAPGFTANLGTTLEDMWLQPSEDVAESPSLDIATALLEELLLSGPMRSDLLKAQFEQRGLASSLMWDVKNEGQLAVRCSKDHSGAWYWQLAGE